MKSKFQLKAVAVALIAVTGGTVAVAAPITEITTDIKYGSYDRLLGKEDFTTSTNLKRTEYKADYVNNPVTVSKAANEAATATLVELDLNNDGVKEKYLAWTLTDERHAGSELTSEYFLNDTNISATEEASVSYKSVSINDSTILSGTALNDGVVLQAVVTDATGKPLDANGNVTSDVTKVVTVGSKFRGDDSKVGFTADDLKKVQGATKVVNNVSNTFTEYKAGQALDTTFETKTEVVNESNAIAYNTDGKAKQSAGTTDFIVTGVHKNNNTNKISVYQDGKSALDFTVDSTSEYSDTTANYNYKKNAAGEYLDAAGNVTTDLTKRVFTFTNEVDGENVTQVSNVTSFEEKTNSTDKWYQANQTKVYEGSFSGSEKTTRTDIFDGFVSSNESTESNSFVDYGNAKHTLDYATTSSNTYKTKDREFETNNDGSLVIKNGKPIVKNVTEANGNSQREYSQFEATEYQAGASKGQDTLFLKNGQTTTWTDSAIEHSVNNSEDHVLRTDAVDGFVAHSNFKVVDTAKYARNLQENIEVSRDLVANSSSDVKDITRDYTFTTTTGDQVVLKDVSRKIDGSEITTSDVREWTVVGTDGKQTKKYFVVVGNDLDGREIREEVGYVAATANDQKANVITQSIFDSKASEKVYSEGGKIFYDKTAADSWNNTETVQGAAVGDRVSGTGYEKTTLYTRGNGNALDHEIATSLTWDDQDAYERDAAGNIILENGKPVVKQIDQRKGSVSLTEKLYQIGQAKTDETISKSTWDNKKTDIAGNVLATQTGHDNDTTVNYAEGQELATTFVRDAASNSSNVAFGKSEGYDYTGTAKVDADGNWLSNGASFVAGVNAAPVEGIVTVDQKVTTKNTQDTKIYQAGGDKAYTDSAIANLNTTYTYADGTTGADIDDLSTSVTVYNKGKNTKYREATSINTREVSGKTYQTDEDGDLVLKDGKPVEVGTSTNKVIVNTTANDYQLGQALKSDTLTTSNTVEKSTSADGVNDKTVAATISGKTYRSGEFVTQGSTTNNETRKATIGNKVVSDYTYALDTTNNDYRNGEAGRTLLAQHELDIVTTTKHAESLTTTNDKGEKTFASIERTNSNSQYSDESNVWNNAGKSVNTAAGVTVQVDDSQVESANKFGNYDTSVRSNTVTTTQADKSAVSNNLTRTDSVIGLNLNSKNVATDKAGKVVTVEKGTSITAGTVASDRLQAPQIVLAGRNQVVDANGVASASELQNLSATSKRLTGKYKVANQDVYQIYVFNEGKATAQYFTKDKDGQFVAFKGDTSGIEKGTIAPVSGGTTANTDSKEILSQVKNVITDKNVTYGESTSTRGVTVVDGSLNDGEKIQKAVVGTTEAVITQQSVVTGVISQTDAGKVYGVEVTKDGSKTSVTALGVTTTGTVKAATIEATDVKATTINATGNISADGVISAKGGFNANGKVVANVAAGVADSDAANYGQVKAAVATSQAYTDASFNRLSHRLDNVEKTAYRGVAISLAAQQAVPNMKPGNFAVYGGLGHYESESAGALGIATLLDDGRTSISAALGFAESEVGGRVGVSYVFGN